MLLPPDRSTMRWAMAVVAVLAPVCLVANPDCLRWITDWRVALPVTSVVASAWGVGAMRRPLLLLLPTLAMLKMTTVKLHGEPDVIYIFVTGCVVGWIVGAPAGLIFCRRVKPEQ
jgi:hypothetical protein